MRVALHWRGGPLLALNVLAQSPADADPSFDPPMGLSAASGGLQERADPMEPDTAVFGFATRPESAA